MLVDEFAATSLPGACRIQWDGGYSHANSLCCEAGRLLREAAWASGHAWAGQSPFGGCDAARRPLRGQPGCSWAPPSQPVHRVEASYTSAEPVCSAWALQRAPQAAEPPEHVFNPSEAPLRSDRCGRCAVRHHQLGSALPARARRETRHPRTRKGAPDSPRTQPCLRRKLRASLAAHTEPCQALRLACSGLWTPSKPAW